MDWEDLSIASVLADPVLAQVVYLTGIALVAGLSLVVARRILVAGIRKIVSHSSVQWDDQLVDAQLFARLAPSALPVYEQAANRTQPLRDEVVSPTAARARLAAEGRVAVRCH